VSRGPSAIAELLVLPTNHSLTCLYTILCVVSSVHIIRSGFSSVANVLQVQSIYCRTSSTIRYFHLLATPSCFLYWCPMSTAYFALPRCCHHHTRFHLCRRSSNFHLLKYSFHNFCLSVIPSRFLVCRIHTSRFLLPSFFQLPRPSLTSFQIPSTRELLPLFSYISHSLIHAFLYVNAILRASSCGGMA